jgi:hypothetical protein
MANNLKFSLGADVSEALKGMTAVEQRSIVLQKQIEFLQQVVGNTTSVKQFNTAMDALARKQSELSQITAKAGASLKGIKPGANEATQSLTNLSRIAQDAPFGFIGIANNINPLVESFGRLKQQTGTTGGALKALAGSLTGAGGLGLAVGVGTALLTVFGDRLFSTKKKVEETEDATKKLKDSLNGVFSGVAKEAASVTSLVAVLSSETETRQRKLAAIKELQQIQPDVFRNLKLEGDEVVGLDTAYKNYLGTLKTTIAAKIKQAQIEQEIEKLLKLEGATLVGLEKSFDDFTKAVQNNQNQQINGEDDFMGARDKATKTFGKQEKDRQNQIKATTAEIKRLTNDLKALSTGVEINLIKKPKVKQDKPLDLVFQPIVPDLGPLIANRVLAALKSPDILSESQQIGKIINDSIAKNIKPLPSIVNPDVQNDLEDQRAALQEQLKLAQSVASGISNAFDQAFGSILEGENVFTALGNALKGFVLELVQATLKALIFRAIVNAFVPGGAAAVGSTGLANLLGFRANGGPVTGQSPYIVGERGPELFVPSVSGRVVPNNQLGSFNGRSSFATGGGGRSIVRGTDILLASARTQRSISRVNA